MESKDDQKRKKKDEQRRENALELFYGKRIVEEFEI
jgi:hypothetical protein